MTMKIDESANLAREISKLQKSFIPSQTNLKRSRTPISKTSSFIDDSNLFVDENLPEGEPFFAVLSGERLKLYDSEEASQAPVEDCCYIQNKGLKYSFIIFKDSKADRLETDLSDQSFIIKVQEGSKKMVYQHLRIEVMSDQYFKRGLRRVSFNTNPDPYREYKIWLEAIKRTQRPIWVDPQIQLCYICEIEFSRLIKQKRQHHCRKCGTAVCHGCSNQKIELPELGYYEKVRICKNCHEQRVIF